MPIRTKTGLFKDWAESDIWQNYWRATYQIERFYNLEVEGSDLDKIYWMTGQINTNTSLIHSVFRLI